MANTLKDEYRKGRGAQFFNTHNPAIGTSTSIEGIIN